MRTKINISLYSSKREKVLDLYDSQHKFKGAIYNIFLKQEASGWKTLRFDVPAGTASDEIKNEFLVRFKEDEYTDWYVVQEPTDSITNKKAERTVECVHLASQLRNKKLYLEFDGENDGIGKAQDLAKIILAGTGWTLDEEHSDKFYEKNGTVEKIRTLKTSGKTGALNLMEQLGSLFGFYCEYEGEGKTVKLRSIHNKEKRIEVSLEKNATGIKRTSDSSNLVTRLYVEGDYGEDGYLGIDDVNPIETNFIVNFDYYKEIGMFADEQEQQWLSFLEETKKIRKQIYSKRLELETLRTELSDLWGSMKFVFWTVKDGMLQNPILVETENEEFFEFKEKDRYWVFDEDFSYREEISSGIGYSPKPTDKYLLKQVTRASGKIGGLEVLIEAKKKSAEKISKQLASNQDYWSEEKKRLVEEEIRKLQSEIYPLETQLQDLITEACKKFIQLRFTKEEEFKTIENSLLALEEQIAEQLGEVLKDGFYNDFNYVKGQEQALYDDAVEILKEMSRPKVTYDIGVICVPELYKLTEERFKLFSEVKALNEELGINELLWVDSIERCIDDLTETRVSLSNEKLRRESNTLGSTLSSISTLSEELKAKKELYDRSKHIGRDGTIIADKIQGVVDANSLKLRSVVSGWYTDSNGNIVFESLSGDGAMMLTGQGFLIAENKDENGDWNWRTAGTGKGLNADEINTGFLRAERIQAGTITADKLSAGVGAEIDLTDNSISMFINAIKRDTDGFQKEVKTWQKFDENGLEIGKASSPFKVVLSNDKLSFKENGREIAYFANNKLYTLRAELANGMLIGNRFDFIVNERGMTLVYRKE